MIFLNNHIYYDLYLNFKDISNDNFLRRLLKKNGFVFIKKVISRKDINKIKRIIKFF